jgi:hypothetical protein
MTHTEIRITLRRYVAVTNLPATDMLPAPVGIRIVQGRLHAEGPPLLLAVTVGWLPDRDGSLGNEVQLGTGRKSWQQCFDDLTPAQAADHSYQIASVIYQRMANRIPAMLQISQANVEAIETIEVDDDPS